MTIIGQNDMDFSLYVFCTIFNINYSENKKSNQRNNQCSIWSFFKETSKGSPASTLYKMTKGVYDGDFGKTADRIEISLIEDYIMGLTIIQSQDFASTLSTLKLE